MGAVFYLLDTNKKKSVQTDGHTSLAFHPVLLNSDIYIKGRDRAPVCGNVTGDQAWVRQKAMLPCSLSLPPPPHGCLLPKSVTTPGLSSHISLEHPSPLQLSFWVMCIFAESITIRGKPWDVFLSTCPHIHTRETAVLWDNHFSTSSPQLYSLLCNSIPYVIKQ